MRTRRSPRPSRERSVATILVALTSLYASGCDSAPASDESFTSTTFGYECTVTEVVVDPDNEVVAIEPGCNLPLEVQAFGPGGLFNVVVGDAAGGYGISDYYDPVSVSDGEHFVVDYRAGERLPPYVTVWVNLSPYRHSNICSRDSRGETGEKELPTTTARDCVVSFRVVDEVDLGVIWLSVAYAASGAAVPGCGYAAACTSRFNERDTVPFPRNDAYDSPDTNTLSLAAVTGQGFSAPVEIYRCDVRKPVTGEDLSAEDFVVSVIGARSPPPLGEPLTELPAIEVDVDCSLGSTTTTTLPFVPAACGQPCSPASPTPKARDALYVLNAAVGLGTCKTCICDVNRSGVVDATDGLSVLYRAVGLDALVRCVICAEPVPPGCE